MTARARHLPLLLGLAVGGGGVGGPPTVAAAPAERGGEVDSLSKYLRVYTDVLSLVGRAYVDETELWALVAASIEGAPDALDPFSLYVPPIEVDAYLAAKPVVQMRSGLTVLKERGVAYVVSVEDGSPAAEAGVERGSIVEKLQGQRTRHLPGWKIRQLLAQPPATRVELELIEPTGEKRSASFDLTSLEPPRAHTRTVREVPVLRVPRFSERTAAEIDELLGFDGNKLVIDLRGVAGGEPTAAYRVAARFASGELGVLAGRSGTLQRFESPVPPIWNGDLAVLVDRGTQGAAEILATVLRQSTGATLVGQRSFGHAGKIESISLTSGALLELTGAFYTGPDHEPLARGLRPDLQVLTDPLDEPGDGGGEPVEDEVLAAAIELLLGG